MAQLSRPYQVGLAAIALLAAVWLLLLQGHGSSASTPAPSASQPHAPAHTASTPSKSPSSSQGGGSHIYHGAAPGVEGLTRDISKAHGAVEASQRNTQQLERKSAEASSTTSQPSAAAPASSTATTTPAATAPKTATKPATHTTVTVHHAVTASRQHEVEAQLAKGDIVLILFWNPHGADDQAVHRSVRALRGHGRIALDEARSGEVAAFGSITRGVQIYGTPTLLVVNHHGQAHVLTGLQDSFTIGQAISEARAS